MTQPEPHTKSEPLFDTPVDLLAHEIAKHVTDVYKNIQVKRGDDVMTDTKLFELLRQFAEAIIDETRLRGIP